MYRACSIVVKETQYWFSRFTSCCAVSSKTTLWVAVAIKSRCLSHSFTCVHIWVKPSATWGGERRMEGTGHRLGHQGLRGLTSLCLELPVCLGFNALFWKQGCLGPDYLLGLCHPSFLWLGNSTRFPGVTWEQCSLYLLARSLGIMAQEKKTGWRGHNFLSSMRPAISSSSPASSSLPQAPRQGGLKEWIKGVE